MHVTECMRATECIRGVCVFITRVHVCTFVRVRMYACESISMHIMRQRTGGRVWGGYDD